MTPVRKITVGFSYLFSAARDLSLYRPVAGRELFDRLKQLKYHINDLYFNAKCYNIRYKKII